jgi:hypothetical protein
LIGVTAGFRSQSVRIAVNSQGGGRRLGHKAHYEQSATSFALAPGAQARRGGSAAGLNFLSVDRRMSLVARGRAKPGAPVNWVTNDTAHHLELVSAQAWRILEAQGADIQFNLAASSRRPWLQSELIGSPN